MKAEHVAEHEVGAGDEPGDVAAFHHGRMRALLPSVVDRVEPTAKVLAPALDES
jgi:hypothetical protein